MPIEQAKGEAHVLTKKMLNEIDITLHSMFHVNVPIDIDRYLTLYLYNDDTTIEWTRQVSSWCEGNISVINSITHQKGYFNIM